MEVLRYDNCTASSSNNFPISSYYFYDLLYVIGIWSFIAFLKVAKNQRIQTYLLEKINKSISSLEKATNRDETSLDTDFLMENLTPNDDNNIIKFDDNIN